MKFYIHTAFEPSAKKHLPFFSCFMKKNLLCIIIIFILSLDEEYLSFAETFFEVIKEFYVASLMKLYFFLIHSSKHSSKINTVSPSRFSCNMMYDAYVMQNGGMMLCYAK
jgi:hypothetical protein